MNENQSIPEYKCQWAGHIFIRAKKNRKKKTPTLAPRPRLEARLCGHCRPFDPTVPFVILDWLCLHGTNNERCLGVMVINRSTSSNGEKQAFGAITWVYLSSELEKLETEFLGAAE